ncbi:MAG TPA: BREX system P-loop protein BrxC, partial [Polyangiaceae bacterium]
MLIEDYFEKDVTRAIPPVVYFHEQEPAELKREVEEYIITGGYKPPDSRATEGGIHEQFVRLLTAMSNEQNVPGGPKNPACWISGFYGSGKSSFAKLLGLSLDGRKLPDGKLLSDALLAQDHSPDAAQFQLAWRNWTHHIQPIAAVFDVGSRARDDEHIHSVIVRQIQQRLGYSTTSHLVAEYELRLEREDRYSDFIAKVPAVCGKPWTEIKDSQLVEDYFSVVLHALEPELYTDPMSWVDSRSGSRFESKRSADEAVEAIEHMLKHRCPACTLFIVVDEVSQYVHDNQDRMLALQSFVSALGQRLKGKVWLLATGQQRLEEGSNVASAIGKLKDRFPASLRVHLGVANIRDVVHKRLLRKKKQLESDLKQLFNQHRSELSLYAYRGDELSVTDFVEIYPLLPGHVDLLLDITSGLRSRSARTQGDSHAIRGLLQLLGDLFREKQFARYEVGHLITIDLIYDVLASALDNDVQMTLGRALEFCAHREDALAARVLKAVAMLE